MYLPLEKEKYMPLLEFTSKGIYCRQADVYLDPWRGVDKALITHGHSDHARWGSKRYITHEINIPILQHRLGNIKVSGKKYNETFSINGVQFSLSHTLQPDKTYYSVITTYNAEQQMAGEVEIYGPNGASWAYTIIPEPGTYALVLGCVALLRRYV